jgi:hypothetical protein
VVVRIELHVQSLLMFRCLTLARCSLTAVQLLRYELEVVHLVNIPDARTQPGIWPGALTNASTSDACTASPALHTSLALPESLHQLDRGAREGLLVRKALHICSFAVQMATVYLKYTHQAGNYGLRAVTACSTSIPRGHVPWSQRIRIVSLDVVPLQQDSWSE